MEKRALGVEWSFSKYRSSSCWRFRVVATFFQYAEYYTINIPLGLFRVRSSNQKSIEGVEEYVKEAEKFIKNHSLTAQEEEQIRKYHFYNNFVRKIPFISRILPLEKQYEKLDIFKFPKNFYFDRKSQEIKLE